MEWTEDSTTLDTDAYSDTGRQGLVDHYATLAIQAIALNPWASVAEIMGYM